MTHLMRSDTHTHTSDVRRSLTNTRTRTGKRVKIARTATVTIIFLLFLLCENCCNINACDARRVFRIDVVFSTVLKFTAKGNPIHRGPELSDFTKTGQSRVLRIQSKKLENKREF